MELLELDLPDYRGLRDFGLNLTGGLHEPQHPVTVLIGRNGAGKSRVLHSLVEIFGNLRLGKPADFAFRLRYELRGSVVTVSQSVGGRAAAVTASDGSREVRVRKADWPGYLPDHLFGYQAIYASPWDSMFQQHVVSDAEILRAEDNTEGFQLRPLVQSRVDQLPLILLALVPQWAEKFGPFAAETAGVLRIASAELVIRRPGWATNRYLRDRQWPPYWGLTGATADLFERIASRGRFGPVPDGAVPGRYASFRISIAGQDVDAFCSLFESDLSMFAALERLQTLGVLTADVQLATVGGANLSPADLSAGEQQILTVLGLLRLQRGGESLFLLDEPAAHFHPAWSQGWYESVREMLDDGQRSQFIAATHDPTLVANVPREQIRIVRKTSAGRTTAHAPETDPRGHSIGDLLTSELYGLETQLDRQTQLLIDRQYELLPLAEEDEGARAELERITFTLDGFGFATARRDHTVALFLAELARRRRNLIEAAGSDTPPDPHEVAEMVRLLFDERFSRGL
ncbi:AAA family ATPase [Streptomyces sp. VNUA24]|uniref:AAA family ATPase n=1 Tax=Streptomyces sp. VNUA24 TaxID=3031131 RepID=UPI0023B831E0|nr:AAA family ATPase [Streptomyces sp. VNUA24]WEH18105.1 AAA family ATPase [Streptomyces sp. VNUA24]